MSNKFYKFLPLSKYICKIMRVSARISRKSAKKRKRKPGVSQSIYSGDFIETPVAGGCRKPLVMAWPGFEMIQV